MSRDRFTAWPEEYATKLVEPSEAVKLVRPGDRVVVPIGSLTPALCEALFARREDLHDVEMVFCAPFVDPGWFEPGHPAFRTVVEIFNTSVARQSMVDHRTDFISVPFSRRFKAYDEPGRDRWDVDVALISVSSPDRFGFCSYGLSMWNKAAYAKRARIVLAEVFGGYPRTGGANQIHVSEIDAFVEGGELTPRLPASFRQKEARLPVEIAAHVNELVHDGDTVQVGTGATTAMLVHAGVFNGKEDLGVHSEITVGGMNALVQQGVFTGARKTRHKGKFVATAIAATTPEEIEFVHENPVYEVYDVEYTNDIRVIASHDNMVAINNAMTVDLLGQAACESIGPEMWSGPGGQLEFVLGAMLSRGGRSITVVPAASRDGAISRIVPQLPAGTVVTVPRQFIDYVVTEYGVAKLYGKSDRERAEELISVAHPDHRAELRRQAGKLVSS